MRARIQTNGKRKISIGIRQLCHSAVFELSPAEHDLLHAHQMTSPLVQFVPLVQMENTLFTIRIHSNMTP